MPSQIEKILPLDQFVSGRCEEVMKTFPSQSVDFVFTSPPYADKRSYGVENTKVNPNDFVDWFKPMAKEIKRVLKRNGSFVLNICDKVVYGEQHLYVFELVLFLCKKMGFKLVRDYIWYNPAPPPEYFFNRETR